MDTPILVACAANGAYKTKADHPSLPITTHELVETALSIHQAGATMLHLHVRDDVGKHTLDPTIYRRTISAIEDQLGDQLIIQITSEAGGIFDPAYQIACVKAVKPACVSIALREIVPTKAHETAAQSFFEWMALKKVAPQFILYDLADIARYHELTASGVIPAAPHSVLFVIGRYQPNHGTKAAELNDYLDVWPKTNSPSWMVCAFGPNEIDTVVAATHQGGHARIGFENSLLTASGKLAEDNATQITHVVSQLKQQSQKIASTKQSREILGITSNY